MRHWNTFTVEECENGGGAKVDFTGELRFERSMHMRFLFSDPEQSTASPSEPGSDEAALIVAGSRVPIPRQTVFPLAGCSPSMTARVVEADGRVACVEQPLTGRARSAA